MSIEAQGVLLPLFERDRMTGYVDDGSRFKDEEGWWMIAYDLEGRDYCYKAEQLERIIELHPKCWSYYRGQ